MSVLPFLSDGRSPMPSAFISHSSPDDRYVTEFVHLVKSAGYDEVFNDGVSIQPGEEFWPRIEAAIRECEGFYVVLSHASVKSVWVDREVQLALSLGKKVVPIRIDDCKLPPTLDGRDVLDLRPGRGDKVKIAPSRILRHAPARLFGREEELKALDDAWAEDGINLYTLVAWGGVGKTSLVAHWVQTRFAANKWPGVERYFDWSFYSQGTGESRQTSADLFISEALTFFGDPDPTRGSPWERGERLAGLVRMHRTLLVLDGIEPLQYPPNDKAGLGGQLKDPALAALVQSLAADNTGLCVVTTREHLRNVEAVPTSPEKILDHLHREATIALLRHLRIAGTDEELAEAGQAVRGHALTLQLLGRFIADAYPHDRDIRHYRQVKFTEAEEERKGRSAFKVMIAYERWFQSAGAERQRELALLRLTGLFDRPISAGCLGALRAEPAIPGLTDALVGLKDTQWNAAISRLTEVDLVSRSGAGEKEALDAHPLVREYFADQLQKQHPEAFKAAHSRLFDFLCNNTPHRPDTLEGLAPLYEAVVHGCHAGRHEEACDKVYIDRITRGEEKHVINKLGAIGADLAAVAAFFDAPWSRVSSSLHEGTQAWLLNQAAFRLRALGRLTEALQPMRTGLEMRVQQKVWKSASIIAGNLSELEGTLGRLQDAVTDARQSITHADQSGDEGQRMIRRTTAANALHLSGRRVEAGTLFDEAERMQKELSLQFDYLYSLRGFQFCDWLLVAVERAAGHVLVRGTGLSSNPSDHTVTCEKVEHRAAITLQWAKTYLGLLDNALDHLTLARVGLIRAILENPLPQPTLDLSHVAIAVNGFRAAGTMDHLPLGLLTAALYHFVRGEHDLARKHLAETQQIAERGPMPLFLADVHLHRARMFKMKGELAKAAKLIRELGYGRRFDELADAEEAAKGW